MLRQIICSLVIISSFQAVAKPDQQANELYRQALQQAKAGRTTQALSILDDLIKRFPHEIRYQYDQIQILGWDGQDEEVIARNQSLDADDLPIYVLSSVARAQRNLQHFKHAEQSYRKLRTLDSNNTDFMLGLASVLIDQTLLSEAEQLINRAIKAHPHNIDVLLVKAYLHEAQEDYLAAADCYQQVLKQNNLHRDAIRGYVFAINRNKSYILAYEFASQHRSLFQDEEWIKLNWDRAATFIRWGEAPVKNQMDRYVDTNYAIALIEDNLRLLDSVQLKNKQLWWTRAHFDLVVALRDRKRMHDVLDVHDTLQHKHIQLPAYAKIAVADALLFLQQPEAARDLYKEVLQEFPESYNAGTSLATAMVETEEIDDAITQADKMAALQPKKLWYKSPKGGKILYSRGNPKKTETEIGSTITTAYANRLARAFDRSEFLYQNASFNTDIRSTRAHIALYRGWPRQALDQLQTALNIEPQHLGLQAGLSKVYRDLHDYKQEHKNTLALYKHYSEDNGVQKLKRLWDIHNMRELKIFTNGGFSSGSAQGSESISVDAYLYSRPLDYHWRAYSRFRWQTGKFQEGRGYFERYGLGLEYSIPDWQANAEIHYDTFDGSALGVRFDVSHEFNDYWSAALNFDSHSDNISLRGFKSGVTAYGQQLSIRYRQHESRHFELRQQYFNYSDNNNRYAAYFTYYQRWISGPIYKFATHLNVGYSHNSNTDGFYFSPANDVASSITLDNDILTYRHYDLAFNQRIALTIGPYWQDNHGTDMVGQILYEHRWQAHNRYQLVYGATHGYPVYDGIREATWHFHLNLNIRF